MEILPNLPLKGIIKNHYTAEVIKQTIMDRIEHIPNMELLRGTVQLISLICNMIEELTKPKNRKSKELDKKEIALQILEKLFDISDLEKGIAGKNIEYLHDSKGINRANKAKKARRYIKNLFLEGKTLGE
jgi:hypothetical protein